MNMKSTFCTFAALLVAQPAPLRAAEVVDLRCEYLKEPLGIGVVKPRLSWVIEDRGQESGVRGISQTAYQVLVASDPELLARDQGDLWDSGKVDSDQSNQVEYAGKPLESRMRCHWKVRVWTSSSLTPDSRPLIPVSWSRPASWSMGLLEPADPASPGDAVAGWQAKWIGHDAAYQASAEAAADDKLLNIQGLRWVQVNGGKDGGRSCFRRRIDLAEGRKVRRAVLALYAYHFCEAAVNGVPVGEAMHWDRTARLDLTKALRSGVNVVTLAASHTDPYNPAVIGRLVVQFESGEDLVIPIDDGWKASQDAADGWETPGFDDGAWAAAEVIDGTPWRGPGAVSDVERLPAPYLRKDFSVGQSVKRAMVHVTALGVYQLHLNGKPVGNDVLAPGWTEFRKRVHYQTYDVTAQVRKGGNTIGAILGDGWYAGTLAHLGSRNNYGGRPRFMAQLVLELADGSTQVVVSDETWKAAFGPIRHADLLMGCELDNRLAMPGWDAPGFADHGWVPVAVGNAERAGVADVAQPLRAAIKSGRLVITLTNEAMGGDPAPGVVKSLELVYRLGNGPEQTQRFPENAAIELGDAGQPIGIRKATYGRADGDGGAVMKLQASLVEPSRRIQELQAIKVTEPRPGCWTFDLGQNMVGWVRLKARGPAGRRITVRHGEMLNPDGTIYTASLRSCQATDFYTLSGKGEEILEPYFTFHGFRYVEVRGLDEKPDADAVTGIVVHTPMRRTGSFECSSAALNQLYSNIIWGQKGNYLEVPTDCPQRDERMGWTGDTQFFAPTAAYNFDVAAFFTRWLTSCEDNQYDDGTFPNVVPDIMGGGGSTAWGDAALLCTYNIYRSYGDTRIVRERFAALERYMRWLATKTKDGISLVGGFGDWLNAGGGAKTEVIDTAYHAHLARIMSEMAAAIGRKDEAARYAKLHEEVKAAFVREFLQADGSLTESSQTGYALAFSMDLLPAGRRAQAADKFVEEIKRFDWHLATGFIGTPRLLPALNAAGRNDVAYRLLLTDTYPSWLYPVKNGATTMWERWNGWTPEGFGDISMNSYNHYAFGAVGEYLYGGVGGIQAASPGYKAIVIRPVIGEGLSWAKTAFESIHGRIASDWKREGDRLTMEVTIPANTTATVHVPASDAAAVTEGGLPVAKVKGVKLLRMRNNSAVFAVGSGNYVFQSTLAKIIE